ncbi:ribonuclease HI [Clostridium tetanomorphum]|uniref:ribonuclease H n=1 Tax=Clostridium tetanomorphum TaxID=1553 RepID=A0A923E9Z4_CLOTT|nr:ribonuclease HI [Clostridium tetanomorphum]KAJ50887.1 ribonuclease H [Clostridium tetanomorphum DSM 665]MBC2397139.1 ribonuclease HI [Clostridium tetanomorphum]MBP1863061.1 ribonuclease HI [Clostridium tetanomorphum]NRS82890.1 ribonuclease HI [Clostridium tetanomorphum]NRZ99014.1 ribonuclease HI [Clostridium tetanomorphum]
MKKVIIYTDGACRGNGKENTIGGYGIVLMYNEVKKEIKKAVVNTTNNIMELTAVIEALSLLKEPCEAEVYSDSAYVVNAINNKWIDSWLKNGWKTSSKEPVKNKELWEKLIKLLNYHKVKFIKVKGHSDNEFNNRCDKLANDAMDELLLK